MRNFEADLSITTMKRFPIWASVNLHEKLSKTFKRLGTVLHNFMIGGDFSNCYTVM